MPKKAYQQAIERASRNGYPLCERCNRNGWLEIHHIKHRSQGGKDELSNLVVLCKACHLEAHNLVNQDKLDNRLSKLQVVSLGEHTRIHAKIKAVI